MLLLWSQLLCGVGIVFDILICCNCCINDWICLSCWAIILSFIMLSSYAHVKTFNVIFNCFLNSTIGILLALSLVLLLLFGVPVWSSCWHLCGVSSFNQTEKAAVLFVKTVFSSYVAFDTMVSCTSMLWLLCLNTRS